MLLFFTGLLILLFGYIFYGAFVEKVVGINERRATPAVTDSDGVDYVIMRRWKNMMIQLLNIAGVGPVIGVIMGIKFGSIVFLIIPIGNILGGAVHDFMAGMMSLRAHGANLPTLIRKENGQGFAAVFTVFMTILLLLVVAVFITTPAQLCESLGTKKAAVATAETNPAQEADGATAAAAKAKPAQKADGATAVAAAETEQTQKADGATVKQEKTHSPIMWIAVVVIFLYYIASTIFPVDKIIGRIYPLFGALLLIGTAWLFVKVMLKADADPTLLKEGSDFVERMWTAANNKPIIPMLFVTIACGILSGFHATQSPIIARTMRSEREARVDFYGMMVVEGFIAMVWAAAALAIYNRDPGQMGEKAPQVLQSLCDYFLSDKFLGSWISALVVISVIVLSITSGDTAMRSLRISLAEILHIPQKKLWSRVLLCLPIIAIVAALIWWSTDPQNKESFDHLWNYFAWGNQVLAACTLTIATEWLIARKRNAIITIIPGMFITFIVICYILWISKDHGGPMGFGLDLKVAEIIAFVLAVLCTGLAVWRGFRMQKHHTPRRTR